MIFRQQPGRCLSIATAVALLGALLIAEATRAAEEPVALPPVIPAESVFAGPQLPNEQPVVSAAAETRIPPSADGPGYFSYPEELDKEMLPSTQPGQSASGRNLPPGAKDGILQRTLFRSTWLSGGGSDGFGMTDLATQATLAWPWTICDSYLLFTPHFTVHYLDGPASVDLPSQLYDATLEFRWASQVTPRLGVDLAAAPSVFSDFDNTTSDSFRVTGRAVALWEWTPATKLVAGVAYLGRQDVVIMPVGGVIWEPDDRWRLEAIIPRPRISRRIACDGHVEHWCYLAGEYGGNTWAIRREAGFDDSVTYSDLRLVLGLERQSVGGLQGRLEVGYVFDRDIEFKSAAPTVQPNDTVMLRGEVSF